MNSPIDVGQAAGLIRRRAHGDLAKRQRVRSSAAIVDATDETVAPVAAVPSTTAAVRVRPTRSLNTVAPPVATPDTSTVVPVVSEPVVAPTTRARNPPIVQSSTTPAAAINPVVASSSTPFASLAPPASSSANVSNTANSTSAHTTKALLSTGAWIGIIAGAVALVALIAGYFIFRCVKRRREAGAEFGSFGVLGSGKREKDDDSFVTEGSPAPLFQGEKYGMSQLGNSAGTGGAAGVGSWNQHSNANDFSSRGMQSPTSESGLVNRNGNGNNRYSMQSGVTSAYGAAPLNSPVFRPPPMAAMMNAPPQAMRQSVANPYGAIAAQGMPLPSPIPMPQMPQSPPMGDESGPFADPAWAGKVFKVTRTFEPTMGDELVIYPGDRVQVLMAYDDGWVLGENLDSVPAESNQQPQRGVFPRDCVEELITAPKSGPPAAESAPEQSNAGANLQRAPTLPKMEFGSSGFDESAEQQEDEDEPTSPSGAYGGVFPAGPTIQISSADSPNPTHLSTTSSLNQASDMIDHFPTTPSTPSTGDRSLTPVKEEAGPVKVKRTSSLIASRDADLFMALGEALDKQEKP